MNNKNFIYLVINNKKYPAKPLTNPMWVLEIKPSEIKGYSTISKFISKKFKLSEINNMEINIHKNSTHKTLGCEFKLTFQKEDFSFICEDLDFIPELFIWLRGNNLSFKDPLDLEKLFKDNSPIKAKEILSKKFF